MTILYDLLIIGGGINGAGIARDASGRKISVCLVDKNTVGSATSSWSTKLIHGGLRYLENYNFRLVRESLKEREIINYIAKDIIRPLPFIIPHTNTLRPRWYIRLGLFIYDLLAGKSTIPKSSQVTLQKEAPNILLNKYKYGFKYFDLQVDDKELVKLNIDNAKKNGAKVIENAKIINIKRNRKRWVINIKNLETIEAKIIINASGPWVNDVLSNYFGIKHKKKLRLVKGSHLITKKLYEQDIAFTLQNDDKRIIFVIPYKKEFTLIGTTEIEVMDPNNPKINNDEIDYLITSVNNFFVKKISANDIIDTFSGIRPLIDDFKESSRISRDYYFDLNTDSNLSPLLNIYGGKLTTYRILSEKALISLKKFLPHMKKVSWTHNRKL